MAIHTEIVDTLTFFLNKIGTNNVFINVISVSNVFNTGHFFANDNLSTNCANHWNLMPYDVIHSNVP